MVLAMLSLAVGQACVQALNQSMPHSELNGSRFSVTLLVCAGYFCIKKRKPNVQLEDAGWVFGIALTYTLLGYAAFGKTFYIPLGLSNGITFTMDCVGNLIVGCVVNKHLRLTHLLATVVGITGLILVTQPSFIFQNPSPSLIHNNGTFVSPCVPQHEGYSDLWTNSSVTSHANYTEVNAPKNQIIGYTLSVVESIVDVIFLSILNYKLPHVNLFALNFCISLTAVIISFAIMGFTETPTLPSQNLCWVFFAVHILISGNYTFMITGATQILSPIWVALGLTMVTPLTSILQYTLLSGIYPGHANVMEIVGFIVVFGGNIFVPVLDVYSRWAETRRQTQ